MTTTRLARLELRPLALLIAVLVGAWAHAAGGLVALAGVEFEVTEGAVLLRHAGVTLVYVDGLGWLADLDAPPPVVDGGLAWAAPAVARALGVAVEARDGAAADDPGRLLGVRMSGAVDLRVVLDIDGIAVEELRPFGTVGRAEPGERLRLALPPLALPADLPSTVGGVALNWVGVPAGTGLELAGDGFGYDVFALAEPTRLVIDLRPDRDALPAPSEEREVLAPGVEYRTFRAPASGGPSRVHLLQVAPAAGEWRVVGAPGEARPTLTWADGAFVAINGGYFDPSSRSAIGFLVVDGTWLSPPSRGRAVVGFGPEGIVIDRVVTRTAVWADETLVLSTGHALATRIELHGTPGAWAGSPRLGALRLDADGVVLANRVGPVRVPEGGQVLIYPPELRALALADEGTRIRTWVTLEPAEFTGVRYAVEAGPLLLKDGRDAFAPELEAFGRGVRILDEVTQQAAIGVTADGTVLLVAAEAMIAADLVPLLLDLGAVDAMRLDSGGSTTLVADGRVLNRRTERSVVNAIVWRPEAGR